MWKKGLTAVLMMTALLLTGCAGKSDTAREEQDQPIDVSEYLIADASKYVTLGDFNGMEVESAVYSAHDEDVEAEISNRLYEMTEETHPDREITIDDVVMVDMTTTVDGVTETVEDVPIDLGYLEYGPEMDAQLPGHKSGDTVTFEDTFGDDAEVADWVGKTVSFEVKIKYIEEINIPELTDQFVKDTFGAKSVEEYRQQVKEELEQFTEINTRMQDGQMAVLEGMSLSEFSGYPEDVYEDCLSQVKEQYDAMADSYSMTTEELYEAFGFSDGDVEAEALEQVNRRLFLAAVFEKEQLELRESDLREYTNRYYVLYGFEDAETMETEMGRDWLITAALEDKVGQHIAEMAEVIHVEPSYELDDLEMFGGPEAETEDWELDTEDWDEFESMNGLPFSNEFFYGEEGGDDEEWFMEGDEEEQEE